MEPRRLTWSPGGSDGALEAQMEPWRLRLSPGGSDGALKAQMEPKGAPRGSPEAPSEGRKETRRPPDALELLQSDPRHRRTPHF